MISSKSRKSHCYQDLNRILNKAFFVLSSTGNRSIQRRTIAKLLTFSIKKRHVKLRIQSFFFNTELAAVSTSKMCSLTLPLINSVLTPEKILKSRSGVMMAVMFPNILPTPNSRSIEKYSTDQSWDTGIFLIASLYIMKARPGPSAAWKHKMRREKTQLGIVGELLPCPLILYQRKRLAF